ncbi:hypothetical protein EGR_10893 [Echinococcus granulosus]|uniref:Uncharacterized protein n=1 Tax=Echinococcus granulosus TaxID=6210 RepID=W6TZJ0_ECHGR|nr:hypothetical protein EGR_10893 [Echinococcus granulosus]EUB54245.1 hypothetical protein EGR_10893 [Echinococcus granulosus]
MQRTTTRSLCRFSGNKYQHCTSEPDDHEHLLWQNLEAVIAGLNCVRGANAKEDPIAEEAIALEVSFPVQQESADESSPLYLDGRAGLLGHANSPDTFSVLSIYILPEYFVFFRLQGVSGRYIGGSGKRTRS